MNVQVFTSKHLERTPGKTLIRSLQITQPAILGAGNPTLTPTEKLRTVSNSCFACRCRGDAVASAHSLLCLFPAEDMLVKENGSFWLGVGNKFVVSAQDRLLYFSAVV